MTLKAVLATSTVGIGNRVRESGSDGLQYVGAGFAVLGGAALVWDHLRLDEPRATLTNVRKKLQEACCQD